MSGPSTSYAFPTTDLPGVAPSIPVPPSPQRRQHLLSFRRISLPTPPVLLNRQSSASLTSCESFPEEGGNTTPINPPGVAKHGARKGALRPSPLEPSRKSRKRRDSIRPPDETKQARRRKIVAEFYDTERAYVEGLDLIYSHFLTPIIESLEGNQPLLDREDLITVFSNFIDIWNLHRSFYTSLSDLLSSSLAQSQIPPPPLSPVLISHFPYLSLYTPFITSFPAVISRLTSLSATNTTFDAFIKAKEADVRCGKLKLRDWLLTIVQRCPRYLLLLKDLISCTEQDDPEHANLLAAHALLSKVTSSLDTSLHTHAQTLNLLALQRTTPNLPIQLISPGRSLLKRGTLMQLDNASDPKEREFILFTDCLIWLAKDGINENDWLRGSEALGIGFVRGPRAGRRPEFKRTRSKSENELPTLTPAFRSPMAGNPRGNMQKIPEVEEKWLFKGKVDLVDVELVVAAYREPGDERRFEILSPETSFATYADTEGDRDDWASAIRGAKASLLVALNVMHPNSTLASSSSTNHIRRSLQALPYMPEDDEKLDLPKRGKVDHFMPAIWVPDGKTDSCMRCGRSFGWRRRRHHCRLCGRCICARCSERTFFISDPSVKYSSKSARSCNACYDTVFPILESSSSEGSVPVAHSGSTLSSFPSWKTQKPIPLQAPRPSELMALGSSPRKSNPSSPEKSVKAGSPRQVEVVRRPKPRPLSHPVLPRVFLEPKPDKSLPDPPEGDSEENEVDPNDQGVPSEVAEPLNEYAVSPSGGDDVFSPALDEDISPGQRKRFSMPAIALQTTSVTTRPNAVGEGRSKRFSLVLGIKHKGQTQIHAPDIPSDQGAKNNLGSGGAAARLTELLERSKSIEH